jgi:hypothetical protein
MNEPTPYQANKRRCQYAAYALLVIGVLKMGAFKASASVDVMLGALLLFAVGKDNLRFVMTFHYFAVADTVSAAAELLGDIQRKQSPFHETGSSAALLRWAVTILTLVVRIVGMYFGFKLYQSIRAAQFGFISHEELALDMFPQQEMPRQQVSVNDRDMQPETQNFKAFRGKGASIGV